MCAAMTVKSTPLAEPVAVTFAAVSVTGAEPSPQLTMTEPGAVVKSATVARRVGVG